VLPCGKTIDSGGRKYLNCKVVGFEWSWEKNCRQIYGIQKKIYRLYKSWCWVEMKEI